MSTNKPESLWKKLAAPVIAAGIIGGLSVYSATFRGWLVAVVSWTGHASVSSWTFLVTPMPVPRVVVGIIGLVLVVWVLRAIARGGSGSGSGAGTGGPRLSYQNYTEDEFEGLLWNWGYTSGGSIPEIVARCPVCHQVLVIDESYEVIPGGFGREGRDVSRFRCENCGIERGKLVGIFSQVKQRMIRNIDRKVHTGEWRAVVESKLARS